MFARIKSFLIAITSGRDEVELQRRLNICKSCKHMAETPAIENPFLYRLKYLFTNKLHKKLWCKECGCGSNNPVAELHHKLGYKKLKCPLNLWGEEGALTIAEADKSLMPESKRRAASNKQRSPLAHLTDDQKQERQELIEKWKTAEGPEEKKQVEEKIREFGRIAAEQARQHKNHQGHKEAATVQAAEDTDTKELV